MKKFKIKGTYVLKHIMDNYLVVPLGGDVVDFNSMINLNETGAFIWECLGDFLSENEIADKLCGEFGVSRNEAAADIASFVKKLDAVGVLEYE